MNTSELEKKYPTFKFQQVQVVKGFPWVNFANPSYEGHQAYCVVEEMTPGQYFANVCELRNRARSEAIPSDLITENVDEYAEAMKRGDVFDSAPALTYPFPGEEEGHQEGRHRVCAYYKAFGKPCPVVVIRPLCDKA